VNAASQFKSRTKANTSQKEGKRATEVVERETRIEDGEDGQGRIEKGKYTRTGAHHGEKRKNDL